MRMRHVSIRLRFFGAAAAVVVVAALSLQPAAGQGAAATISLWPSTATPGTLDNGDTAPYELGVRFQSDTNGVITAIRYYKSAANTGTHVGHLWSATGTLLGTATF